MRIRRAMIAKFVMVAGDGRGDHHDRRVLDEHARRGPAHHRR
jgi:hypothetical protein